jgi:hypothetical protein
VNIFAIHYDPHQAARWHCDAHVVKMILESAQMLCTAHHVTGGTAPYRAAFAKHPCSIWVRASRANYLWLAELGIELCREYTARYGKAHASEEVLRNLADNVPALPDRMMTPFAQAMPDELKGHDPVQAYRRYYQTKRGGKLGTWRQNRPEWFTPQEEPR